MEKDTRIKRIDNFVSRQLGDEEVLIPINQTGVDVQKLYALNPTAAIVWELLEIPRTFEEIVALLEEEYSAPDGVIMNEIDQLVEDLTRDKLLIVVEE